MLIEPSCEAFEAPYSSGTPQVVWTRLIADLETPVSAMMKIAADQPNAILLESVEGGAVRGRYSLIGLDPDIMFRCNGAEAEINTDIAQGSTEFTPCEKPSLEALRDLIDASRIDIPEGLPPMSAGIFGYLGYDMVRQVEELPDTSVDVLEVPDTILVRPQLVVIFDAVKDEMVLVTPVRPKAGQTAKAAYNAAVNRLTDAIDRIEEPAPRQTVDVPEHLELQQTSNTTPERYREMVEAAKDYITAGDIFQVVLSQRFQTPFPLPAFSLYRALRRTNPAPFLYFLNFEGFSIVGSSPEILVRARDGEITVRPIAGTRPRGATAVEDKAYADDLLADPKECAEHLMLLDLGRNDVGRIAKIGSVKVTDKFFLEYYSQVMHIVSNVVGELADDHDALDALAAGFPAGTVSGAPKVRAMEIIDELEHDKRGPYAGCVGYFSADGNMDTCIVLRTAVVKDGVMHVQAGAGIVADSVPENEQQECINKAKALFRAADEALRVAQSGRRAQ
ncbi:anthranilate synthase component I [Coralliovum pocilloporae]|uniref:anthranilate synthase component I n=1 Tax=Coralliovum pocilloporae TaxID=3066369 RepID=UPI0033079F71